MSETQTGASTSRKPLRLWPGVALAILLVILRFAVPLVMLEAMPIGMIGALVCGMAIVVVWWLFFSRAPWSERLGVIVLMIVAVFITSRLVHASIAGGAMGALLYVWAVPTLGLALVVAAAASRGHSAGARRALLVTAIVLACGLWALIRTDGVTSDLIGSDFHWRWTPTAEQRLLAQRTDEPVAPPRTESAPTPASTGPAAAETPSGAPEAKAVGEPATIPAAPAPSKTEPAAAPAPSKRGIGRVEGPATSEPRNARVEGPAMSERANARAEWPGFRGPGRDSIVHGARISTDWSKSPPVAIWRQPIGPGWSSFAVRGDFLYTQEQRGDDEIVACYRVSTGEPVWRHRDSVRFWESNGGAGPRATPTLHNGRVYAFGATGILNALDAASGAVLWSRNVASETDSKVPVWGFTSSPLVVGDAVIVAAAGTLAAYDMATGNRRWVGPHHGGSYSSPQLMTFDGVAQVVLLSPPGAIGVSPADGALLWEHTWDGGAIVQPAMTADGDLLINAIAMTGGVGLRRVAIARRSGGWSAEERWTSTGLKPYFNDFVVHKGHAFGFDGNILSAIDLVDGKRKWKGGRYGNGQLVLLADQDLLLVLSEDGELALVSATPDKFTELARFPALNAKTWNHPVLVGDVLLVRNGEEMAAFRLSLAGR